MASTAWFKMIHFNRFSTSLICPDSLMSNLFWFNSELIQNQEIRAGSWQIREVKNRLKWIISNQVVEAKDQRPFYHNSGAVTRNSAEDKARTRNQETPSPGRPQKCGKNYIFAVLLLQLGERLLPLSSHASPLGFLPIKGRFFTVNRNDHAEIEFSPLFHFL